MIGRTDQTLPAPCYYSRISSPLKTAEMWVESGIGKGASPMSDELNIQIEPWESDSDTCVLRLNRVVATSPEYFSTAEEAADSPLGKKLVAIEGLEAVLVRRNPSRCR